MKYIRIKKIIPFLILFILTIGGSLAYAETLKGAVLQILENSKKIKSAQAKKDAAKQSIKVSYGKWHPQFGLNSEKQREKTAGSYMKNNRIITAKEADLKIEQLLWDFGNASAEIQKSKLLYAKTESAFKTVRQNVILEAATVYLNLKKAENIFKYSQKAEYNTESATYNKQAEKTIYLKDKASRIFNRPAEEILALEPIDIAFNTLPVSVEEAKKSALKLNPNIMVLYFNVKAAEAKIAAQKAMSFFPEISAEAGSTFKQNSSEKLSGHFDGHYAGLKLNYAVNFGGSELNTVKTLREEYIDAVKKYEVKKKDISQKVENAFATYINSKKKIEFLEKQKNPIGIASAKIDTKIAAFALLESIGKLNVDLMESKKSSVPASIKQNSEQKLRYRTVESLIDAWAMAWVNKNFAAYMSCYSDNFIPMQDINKQEWINIRKKRLASPVFIEIAIDITKKEIMSPDTVLITFTQKYRSNLYKDIAIKQLTLKFKDNCWKIIKEHATVK
ncbi:MAG: TolC family protein [Deltaproteobacteria bacterium]|nr:TolC family protein [Deltaproteobacteria bacterium]